MVGCDDRARWKSFAAIVLAVLVAGWPLPAAAQVRLISAGELAAMLRLLPAVDDEQTAAILADDTTIWYNNRAMPSIFQIGVGRSGNGSTSFQPASHNPSGDNVAPHFEASKPPGKGGHPNVEFPWTLQPGGTNRSAGIDHFKALWLPKVNGRPLPVVTFRPAIPSLFGNATVTGYDWVFPVGATLVEVITLAGPAGYPYVFEIRTRMREHDAWAVDIFRPFPEAADLAGAIKSKRPDWQQQANLLRLVSHLESDLPIPRGRLTDSLHPKRAFDVTAGVDRLPALGDNRLVKELLTTTLFKSALGGSWRTGSNGVVAFAPTTEAPFHVVPQRYDGTFLGSDRDSCMNCHNSSLERARKFDARRGWYGNVRGNLSGILSFHPMQPGNINQYRRSFLQAGVVARFDPARHPSHVYNRLKR